MRILDRRRVTSVVGLILLLTGVALPTVEDRLVAAILPTQTNQTGDLKITAWSTANKTWLDGVSVDVTIVNGRYSDHRAAAIDSDGVAWTQVLVGTATIRGHKYRYTDVKVITQTQPNKLTTVQLDFSMSPAPASFDFAIGISGQTNVQQGRSISLNITSYSLSGSGNVTLGMGGCDKDLVCSLNVTSGIPTFSSNLNISASPTALTGTRPLAVVGKGGGVTKRTAFDVNVQPAPEQLHSSAFPSNGATSIQQGSRIQIAICAALVTGYESRRTGWGRED